MRPASMIEAIVASYRREGARPAMRVRDGMSEAVGLIQVRSLEKGFGTAEWGFALGSPFWGNGMFMEGAELVLDFAFEQIGVHRMEARSASHNGRGKNSSKIPGVFIGPCFPPKLSSFRV